MRARANTGICTSFWFCLVKAVVGIDGMLAVTNVPGVAALHEQLLCVHSSACNKQSSPNM
jgi:predicted tellurium resistance membrane protein TerC